MKKLIHNLIVLAVVIVLLQACTPDNDFTIGQPANRVQQLSGTWQLQNVIQTDLLAKGNNFTDPSRPDIDLISQDVTAAAPFTDMKITFTQSNGTTTTFAIDYGAAPRIFRHTAGNWIVDNPTAPGTIKFINGLDTVQAKIGGVNLLSAGKLTLQKIKYQGIKPVIQYNYNFTKN